MNSGKDKICRLCLKTCKGNFEIIQDITKEILEVLLVNMDFDTGDYVNCKKCTEMLQKCFEFKSICVHTEEKLITFVESRKINKTDMRQVYLEDVQNHNFNLCNTEKICRFCMKPVTNFFALDKIVDEHFSDMLQIILPEVTLDITRNPVGCGNCLDSLKSYSMFLKYLQHVQEHIKMYCEDKSEVKGRKVKLNNVVQYVLKKISKLPVDKEIIFTEEQLIESYFSGLTITKECIKEERNIQDESMKEISNSENSLESNSIDDRFQDFIKIEEIEIKSEETIESDVKSGLREGVGEQTRSITNVVHDKEAEIIMDFPEVVVKLTRENFNSCLHCGNFVKGKSCYEICEEPEESVVYKCRFCFYKHKTLTYVKRHVLIHREFEDLDLFRCDGCILKNNEKCEMLKMFECQHCEYTCKMKQELKLHLLTHKVSDNTRMFFCANCEFSSKYKYSLIGHMMQHAPEKSIKRYKCKYCNHESSWKQPLLKHQLKHLKENVSYKCDNCTFRSKYMGSLQAHLKRSKTCLLKSSTEVNMFICAQCAFATIYKESLKKHMKRHTSEESVKELELKKHQKQHHSKPEKNKVYKCGGCSFQTKNNIYFGRHELFCKLQSYNNQTQSKETSHPSNKELRLFQCPHCEYKGKKRSHINAHLKVHKSLNEVDKYTCAQCGFTTKHKQCLVRHMARHNSETVLKKYKCEHCSLRTYRPDIMKKHQLVHNSELRMYRREDFIFKTKYRSYFEPQKNVCKSKK